MKELKIINNTNKKIIIDIAGLSDIMEFYELKAKLKKSHTNKLLLKNEITASYRGKKIEPIK